MPDIPLTVEEVYMDITWGPKVHINLWTPAGDNIVYIIII